MSSVERFHPLPASGDQAVCGYPGRNIIRVTGDLTRIEECTKVRGHILRIDPQGVIYCERCPARWRNEGY